MPSLAATSHFLNGSALKLILMISLHFCVALSAAILVSTEQHSVGVVYMQFLTAAKPSG